MNFEPQSVTELENWMEANHSQSESIWLILAKKDSGLPYIPRKEMVKSVLAFGWVDSQPGKVDDKRFKIRISPRNPKSKWSGINKQYVEELIKEKSLRPSGKKAVEIGKKNGAWTALDKIEKLVIPDDLKMALKNHPPANDYFNNFPKSITRGILEWITNAKRTETREKRINETVELAAQNIRANQYQPKKT